MSDHLPECPWADRGYAFPCICDRLRACEQRVREDMALQYLVSDREQQEQEERAFAAGVQAARDAVAAINPVGHSRDWLYCTALAAIDALRGER